MEEQRRVVREHAPGSVPKSVVNQWRNQPVRVFTAGTPQVTGETYDIAPEELRRVIENMQANPKSVLVLATHQPGGHYLKVAISKVFPSLQGRTHIAAIKPEPYIHYPFAGFHSALFASCTTLEQITRRAQSKFDEGIILESRCPRSLDRQMLPVLVEDIVAIMDGRNDYRFFRAEHGWSALAHNFSPKRVRTSIRVLLLARMRDGCILQRLPIEMMFEIFAYIHRL